MNLNLLNTIQENVNIPVLLLIVIILLLVGTITFLIGYIFILLKKVKFLSKRRFGFLGKPIFSHIGILMLLLSIPLLVFSLSTPLYNIDKASSRSELNVEIIDEYHSGNMYNVTFLVVPFIEGRPWGNEVFTVRWEIEGEKEISKVEQGKSVDNISMFSEVLPKGSYYVKVIAENNNYFIEKSVGLYLY